LTHSSIVPAICLLAAVSAGAQTTTSTLTVVQPDPARVERLKAHHLATTPAALVHFLQNGFPPGTRLADLPTTPAEKSWIVVDVIVECARQRVAESGLTLATLALGLPSEGVRTIIGWDLAQQRPGERAGFEASVLKTLRHNAIVALGRIGDRSRRYELEAMFEREKDPDLKLPCALALAQLGSPNGLPYLVKEASRANRATSVTAGEALRLITGFEYGPSPDDPISRRKLAARNWSGWWKREHKRFRPQPDQISTRTLAPAVRPNPREPRTVRELVDRIAYPNDQRWTIDVFDAYERLRLLGAKALNGLELIVRDEDENLRVRCEAIRLYTQMTTVAYSDRPLATRQPRRAYNTLWWLRWDSNPEVQEVVRQCLARLRKER